MPERLKAAVRSAESFHSRVLRVQSECLCQFVPKYAESRPGVNARRQTHAVFASFQYDRNRDAFPVTAIRMNRTERDLVHSYQPPNGRSLSGTLAKKG